MDVESTRFAAVETRKECAGCLFQEERSTVCNRASELARLRGLPDCDDKAPSGKTYIYILDVSDPRQMGLLPEAAN